MAKMYDEKRKAVRVTAYLDDFDGNVAKWKESFYMVWRYQLTWSFAYSIDLRESRAKGVFIDLLIKPEYKNHLLETMEELGFMNVRADDVLVGIVDASEHDELLEIEELVLDF